MDINSTQINLVLMKSKIYGLKVIPLRKIEDERGAVLHMLRQDSPHFSSLVKFIFLS